MKKILAPLLAGLLLFAAGCSGKTENSVSSKTSLSSPSSAGSSAKVSSAGSSSSTSSSSGTASAPGSSAGSSAGSAGGEATVSKATPPSPAAPQKPSTVTVTFPEGFTLAQIGARLEAKGVCKKADFIKSAQTYDFSYYPLVAAIPSSAKRAYKLEGYLYPDTYEMYTNMKPQDAVGKLLRNMESRFNGKYSYSGMTSDELISLASIIEREADNSSDMKIVSSVFHNRLKAGQRLEADATRDYCTQTLLSPNGPFSDSFKYYYNTYRCAALPAGPICNPGSAALNAAANPASTDYCYFITKGGKYYYQKTLAEHEAKLKELGMT